MPTAQGERKGNTRTHDILQSLNTGEEKKICCDWTDNKLEMRVF